MSNPADSESSRQVKADISFRLTFVDGLRGVAILLVLARHYYMSVYVPGIPRWADIMSLGYLGVHLFLLLSGFCVAWAYLGSNPRPFSLREFVARRAGRILPPYYVALAISLLLALPMSPHVFAWQAITHLTMTHNLFPAMVLALNGPFWSLALESQLYCTFPLILLGFRRFGVAKTLIAILVIQTVFRLMIAQRFGTSYNDLTFVLPWGVLGRDFEFALGAAIALMVGRSALSGWTDRQKATLPWLMVPLGAAAAWSMHHFGVTAPLTDLCWTGAFCILLLAGDRAGSTLHRLLTWRPLTALGVASYSVYLVHSLLYNAICSHIPVNADALTRVALFVPVTAAVIAICAVYYFIVEKPLMRMFHPSRFKNGWRGFTGKNKATSRLSGEPT